MSTTQSSARRLHIRYIATLLRPHTWLAVGLIWSAILLFMVEGLGIGLILLLLNGGRSAILAGVPDWLTHLFVHPTLHARVQVAALTLIILGVTRALLQSLQQILATRLRLKVRHRLQVRLFRHFHTIPPAALQQEQSGRLLILLNDYTAQVGLFMRELGLAIANLVTLLAYLGLGLYISWPLTALTIVVMALAGFGPRHAVQTRLRRASHRTRDLLTNTGAVAHEHLQAMRLIHIFDRMPWSVARYERALAAVMAQEYRAMRILSVGVPLMTFLNVLALAGVMLASTVLVRGSDEVVLTTLGLFLIIIFRILRPAENLSRVQVQMVQVGPMLEAIFDALRPSTIPLPGGGTRPYLGLQQAILFEDVTFSYTSEQPVLQNVSLRIPQGKVTAIVGASGAGKSTIINLLARLGEPDSGQISVDGCALSDFDLASWRAGQAIVSQDVFLFHSSARENLRFARPDASDEEMYAAARAAQAHDFLLALPNGYDTSLDELGGRLSGGQRRRIALARALLMNTDFLILDEATSDLDGLTERTIQETINQHYRGRTILVIAHHLALLHDADYIYVLEAGQIVEQGTHATLVAQGGHYYRQIHAQRPTPTEAL